VIVFIQGAGANVHDGWDRKLVDSLERELGLAVTYPRMPDEADPHYAAWKPALLGAIEDGAILVGHSVGGTMLLHALAEAPDIKPRALILIAAPYIGAGGWPSDELAARTHFDLDVPVVVFHGSADTTVPAAHAELYAKAIADATVHILEGRDHQLNNDLREVARAIVKLSDESSSRP
jgi:pimeloyl-ACP methyl ester carboxylesterase